MIFFALQTSRNIPVGAVNLDSSWQTQYNDFGRPYSQGWNTVNGISAPTSQYVIEAGEKPY